MKKMLITILMILLWCFLGMAQNQKKTFGEWMGEGDKLFLAGKYQECLKLLDAIEGDFAEHKEVFKKFRFNVYKKMGDYKKSLKYGIEWDQLRKDRSPNHALRLAGLYIQMKDYQKALNWLDKSADRGFQNYYIFNLYDSYKPLVGNPRLKKIINKMKKKIGLGETARHFKTIDIKGRTVDLKQLKGKVVLIDFWATWCTPCIKVFPKMKKLYKKYHQKGLEILGISADDHKNKVDKFLTKNPLPWTIVFGGKGWQDPIMRQYGIQNIPSVWLVDKKGVLRHFQVKGEKLEKAIVELLGENSF